MTQEKERNDKKLEQETPNKKIRSSYIINIVRITNRMLSDCTRRNVSMSNE